MLRPYGLYVQTFGECYRPALTCCRDLRVS